jgi:hypothetical protein
MTLFFVGLGLFVLGAGLNALGWRMHARRIAGVPEEYLTWLLEVIRHWFGLLTAPDSDTGQRVAAFGAILAGVGLVAALGGLIAWAA